MKLRSVGPSSSSSRSVQDGRVRILRRSRYGPRHPDMGFSPLGRSSAAPAPPYTEKRGVREGVRDVLSRRGAAVRLAERTIGEDGAVAATVGVLSVNTRRKPTESSREGWARRPSVSDVLGRCRWLSQVGRDIAL
jgi:hypothetical protein